MTAGVILVTDGEQRSSLAITRSLGRAGHEIHVVSASGRSLAGASRFAADDHAVAAPMAERAAFAEGVVELADRLEARLILPTTDPSHLALFDLPGRGLPGERLPIPSRGAYLALSDKEEARRLAGDLGIPVPEQWVLASPDETLPEEMEFPVVTKPSRSVVPRGDTLLETGVRYASDRTGLETALSDLPPEAYPVLVQRRIKGVGEGHFLLRWDGEILAMFAHRRLREKPPTGGQSVYRESVLPDRALMRASQRLLEAVDWRGVAMVEYKRESSTGRSYLMEVNGRFWGSLQLAIDAGVDFPRLLVDAALGSPRPAPRSGSDAAYRVGVRSRWLWGDIDHLIARRHTRPSELPPDQPVGARFLLEFLRPPFGRDRLEVLRLSDPRPFLRETALWFRSLGRS